MSEKPSFFAELKRRNVYKVAVAYAVVGWVIAQVATQIFPFLEIPNWIVRLVIVLIAIGFPIALVIAWAFEATPEGIKRTKDGDLTTSARQPQKHAWVVIVIVRSRPLGRIVFHRTLQWSERRQDGSPRGGWRSSVSQKSIAVLPFENLSDDKSTLISLTGFRRKS